jgi:16S rRNA (cytosine967-C5)-methyltransferase
VRENARRVGRLPLGIIVADARRPPFRPGTFDVVLLDAPCTGTGTFRRRPDGRWRITMRDLDALTRLQRELLRSAAQLVRRGGLLVYATCSIEAEENELQVEAFLEEMRDFEIDPSAAVAPEFLDRRGHLVVLPQHSGFDGAFAARLRRN